MNGHSGTRCFLFECSFVPTCTVWKAQWCSPWSPVMESWFDSVRQIDSALVELKAGLLLASRGQSSLCAPKAFLPCAVGLAACYIKTGASVTESALWKLRGLADGHFWHWRSIIKMKSGDWAEAGMLCGTKSSSSSALTLSAPVCHRLLGFRGGVGANKQ